MKSRESTGKVGNRQEKWGIDRKSGESTGKVENRREKQVING